MEAFAESNTDALHARQMTATIADFLLLYRDTEPRKRGSRASTKANAIENTIEFNMAITWPAMITMKYT